MRVVFRADASIEIGTGHVMRCLTLAAALRDRGAECIFVCRKHPGNLLNFIGQHGYETVTLPAGDSWNQMPDKPAHAKWLGAGWVTDAAQTRQALGLQSVDWLVVDHYALDRSWELAMRSHCCKLMVIDDLADRPHDCDLLLDQNLGRLPQDYGDLLDPSVQKLIGPQFALLRPEFVQWREYSLVRREQPKLENLLITMGGVDQNNATAQVLNALNFCELPLNLRITVVMGLHAPWLAQIRAQAAEMPWCTRVLEGVTNMAQLMADSDLAIGAAGSTSWERCCLGLPTIQVALAENQESIAFALANIGAAAFIDIHHLAQLLPQMPCLNGDELHLRSLSSVARGVCDGDGVNCVASLLSKELHENNSALQ